MASGLAAWYNTAVVQTAHQYFPGAITMAKPGRKLKKANHGSRPANSKARKMKRKHIRT